MGLDRERKEPRKGVLAGKLPMWIIGAESCSSVLGASVDHTVQSLSALVEETCRGLC